jgi:hypothetical protein
VTLSGYDEPYRCAVAHTLEAIVTAYNNYDADGVVIHYAPEAQIESMVAGGVVSRDGYKDALRTQFIQDKNARLSFSQATITMLSSSQSRVETKASELSSRGATRRGFRMELGRQDDRWVVTETRYFGRPE